MELSGSVSQSAPGNSEAAGRALQSWWSTQRQFRKKRELAAEILITTRTLSDYFGGRFLPEGEHRRRLFEITGLSCFRPDADFPVWAGELYSRVLEYLAQTCRNETTRKQLAQLSHKIVAALATAQVRGPQDVTPEMLIRERPDYKNLKQERWGLAHFGRFLVAVGLWTPTRGVEFEQLLSRLYPLPAKQKKKPARSSMRVPSVGQLVRNVGLSPKQILELRVNEVGRDGILLSRGRLVRYGEGWHCVGRQAVEDWLASAKPTDFLFYQRSPIDFSRPASRHWIMDVLKNEGIPVQRSRKVAMMHFDEDARHLRNPRQLRIHLRSVHGLSPNRSAELVRELRERTTTFSVPEPYFAAVLCVSRLLPGATEKSSGGKVRSSRWPSLFERYAVKVTWPVTFDGRLKQRNVPTKVARWLYRLAEYRWAEQVKIRVSAPVPKWADNDTLHALSLTRVEITDLRTQACWRGAIVERRYRGRYLEFPLLDDLEGGPIHGRCALCQHPERRTIDDEVRRAVASEDRNKGLASIARRFSLDYDHLMWHAGRLSETIDYRSQGEARSRVQPKPGHLGSGAVAPLISVSSTLIECLGRLSSNSLILYTLMMAHGKGQAPLQISRVWVSKQLGEKIPAFLLEDGRTLADVGLITYSERQPGIYEVAFKS